VTMQRRQEGKLGEGLHDLYRRVFNLERRIGAEAAEVVVAAAIATPGAGPWLWDYLICRTYTGVDGAEFEAFGHTYKIYSTIGAAVADANVNRQAVLQSTSFGIIGTGIDGGSPAAHYAVATTIDLDPPSGGSYHLYGSGADTVSIEGTMGSGNLFNIPTQSLDSIVEFHHLELRSNQAINLIQGGGSTRIGVDNCWLRPNDSLSMAISSGSSVIGWNISNTNIEGAGIGIGYIGTGLMNIRLTNCYVAVDTGIQMTNDAQVYCSNVKFACSVADVAIGATTGSLAFSANSCEFNKGITFNSGASFCWFDSFIIDGCIFILGSGETGIDYSGVTGAGGLLSCNSHSLVGNTFWTSSATARGIRGGSVAADGPKNVTVVGNSFRGFLGGNEIIDMARPGDENEIAHNTTDSGATLPDTGTGHSILSSSSAGEGISISDIGAISVDTIHSGSRHHAPDTTLLSGTFTIDSPGIKTITTTHGLGYIPAGAVVQLTVIEDTAVDDWSFDLLKIVSVDALSVVAKIRVNAASATGGAVARLAIQIAGSPTYESVFFGWSQTPAALPTLRERFIAHRNRRYAPALSQPFASMMTLSLVPVMNWLQQPPDLMDRRRDKRNAAQSQSFVRPLI